MLLQNTEKALKSYPKEKSINMSRFLVIVLFCLFLNVAASDEITVVVGGSAASFYWNEISFKTNLPNPYKQVEVSSKVKNKTFETLLVEIIGTNKKYSIPDELKKVFYSPDLQTLDFMLDRNNPPQYFYLTFDYEPIGFQEKCKNMGELLKPVGTIVFTINDNNISYIETDSCDFDQ